MSWWLAMLCGAAGGTCAALVTAIALPVATVVILRYRHKRQ